MTDRAIDFEFPRQALTVPSPAVLMRTKTVAVAEVLVRMRTEVDVTSSLTVAAIRAQLRQQAEERLREAAGVHFKRQGDRRRHDRDR